MTRVIHPLLVPALGKLPAALITHSAGRSNGIYLIVPDRWNVGEKHKKNENRHGQKGENSVEASHFSLIRVSRWNFGPVSCDCSEVLEKGLDLFLQVGLQEIQTGVIGHIQHLSP